MSPKLLFAAFTCLSFLFLLILPTTAAAATAAVESSLIGDDAGSSLLRYQTTAVTSALFSAITSSGRHRPRVRRRAHRHHADASTGADASASSLMNIQKVILRDSKKLVQELGKRKSVSSELPQDSILNAEAHDVEPRPSRSF